MSWYKSESFPWVTYKWNNNDDDRDDDDGHDGGYDEIREFVLRRCYKKNLHPEMNLDGWQPKMDESSTNDDLSCSQ